MGHVGFSYMGLIFLLMLFIPNLIWMKKIPQGYTSEQENKCLLFLERLREIMKRREEKLHKQTKPYELPPRIKTFP